jgi:hypothetical protein
LQEFEEFKEFKEFKESERIPVERALTPAACAKGRR